METIYRPFRVLLVLLPFIVSFMRDWKGYLLFGEGRRLTREQHRMRARELTRVFASLGPAFIKGAQVLSTREDILPREYTSELKTLQDRVPPFPAAEARATFAEMLGQPVGRIFDDFEDEPIAAASLGQVHRARYKGQPVAVKILRPGVEKIVEIDLAVVAAIIRFFNFFIDSHFIRSFWAIHLEYTRVIRQEMDFRNEEANAAKFRSNFADDPRVLVPECHTELTTRRTVVFDFVEGCRIDDPKAMARRGMSSKDLVLTLIEIYVRMTIVHGFIHADPHPGNLLVDAKGRIAILDYGMALEFGEGTKLELLRACFCVVRNDLDGLVECFYHLGIVDPDINRALVREAAETLLSIQMRDDFSPRQIQDIADDILGTFHKFPLRMPQQLVYLFRASALVEGIGMMYEEHFSGVREATPIIKRMIRDVALGRKKSWRERVVDATATTAETIKYLHRIILRVEREEQRVRIHQGDIGNLEAFLTALLRRLLIGIGCIGAEIFGAIVYNRTGSLLILFLVCVPSMLVFLLCFAIPLRRRRGLRDA